MASVGVPRRGALQVPREPVAKLHRADPLAGEICKQKQGLSLETPTPPAHHVHTANGAIRVAGALERESTFLQPLPNVLVKRCDVIVAVPSEDVHNPHEAGRARMTPEPFGPAANDLHLAARIVVGELRARGILLEAHYAQRRAHRTKRPGAFKSCDRPIPYAHVDDGAVAWHLKKTALLSQYVVVQRT